MPIINAILSKVQHAMRNLSNSGVINSIKLQGQSKKWPLFIFLLSLQFDSFAVDYVEYYQKVNLANSLFLVENKTEECLKLYTEIFNKYDFVFASDCVVAFQFAITSKKDTTIIYFAQKMFESDVTLDYMKKLYWYKEFNNNITKKKIMDSYTKHRRKYLDRIDINLLHIIYEMYAEDQSFKTQDNFINGYYYKLVVKHIYTIDSLSNLNLFPGEQLIGINQVGLMTELGHPEWELSNIYESKYKKYFSNRDYIYSDYDITPSELLVMLYHYDLSFTQLESVLIKCMNSGQIHPRDVASIMDFNQHVQWDKFDSLYYNTSKVDLSDRICGTLLFSPIKKEMKIEQNKIFDRNRKLFFINSTYLDAKKEEYEKFGYRLFFGFFDHR